MTPSAVTTDALLAELIGTGDLTEAGVEQLLGRDRHDLTLPLLEKALLDGNVISERRLLLLKGTITGRPILDDDTLTATPQLPEKIASAVGAVTLSRQPLTVAIVEDREENLRAVNDALDSRPEIWLCTTPQLQTLFLNAYRPENASGKRVAPQQSAADIYELLDQVIDREATDLHLRVGSRPFLRIGGNLNPIARREIDADWMRKEIGQLLDERSRNMLEDDRGVDFGFAFGNVRFRANVAYDSAGLTLAARILPSDVPSMDALSIPPAVQELAGKERGLVLVTGPTGSGKTTTLASMLQHILDTSRRHVVTLEDPIEYYLTEQQGVVSQRELGRSLNTFSEGLRQALRQDPDVILVGELRDIDTMRTALNAAETGHLVFSTMHTYDAASTLNRMISAFQPAEQDHVRSQLAYLIQGVISQALLPRSDRAGRIAAFEVLLGSSRVRNTLRTSKGLSQVRQMLTTGTSEGMQTLEQSLARLVREGIVAPDEAEFRARDVADFNKRRDG